MSQPRFIRSFASPTGLLILAALTASAQPPAPGAPASVASARGVDLRGSAAADVIIGTPQGDQLSGGPGRDVLRGGEGDDCYYYSPGDGADTILDLAGRNRLCLMQIEADQVRRRRAGLDEWLEINAGGKTGAIRFANGTADRVEVIFNPPSFILVLADDLGFGDLGCYGQQIISTPRLDGLAAEGLRFTQFYSSAPFCPPARNSLLTGRHTGRIYQAAAATPGATVIASAGPLLPGVLGEAGYRVAMFGKWGMADVPDDDVPVAGLPQVAGFDEFVGFLTHRDAQVHFHDSPPTPDLATCLRPYYGKTAAEDPRRVRQFLYALENGAMTQRGMRNPQGYAQEEFIQEALAFIEANADRPFFLYLPLTLPHAELAIPADDPHWLAYANHPAIVETPYDTPVDPYRRCVPEPRRTYAAMISRLDADVGRLADRLTQLGLAGRTLLLFTSDNGPHNAGGLNRADPDKPDPFDSAAGLTGAKFSLYEGGIRVPLVAWGGPVAAPGRDVTEPSVLYDLFPTLLELAGAAAPSGLDGVSLAPWLRGAAPPVERLLYWEYVDGQFIQQTIREGDLKLTRLSRAPGRADDLLAVYDLSSDPLERNPIPIDAGNCEQVDRLKRAMNAARLAPPQAGWRQADIVPLRTEIDRDGDGLIDCADGCPGNATKVAPGECGCGLPDGTCQGCPGDANRDRRVNLADLTIILDRFGSAEGQPDFDDGADVLADGLINLDDVILTLAEHGRTCP